MTNSIWIDLDCKNLNLNNQIRNNIEHKIQSKREIQFYNYHVKWEKWAEACVDWKGMTTLL